MPAAPPPAAEAPRAAAATATATTTSCFAACARSRSSSGNSYRTRSDDQAHAMTPPQATLNTYIFIVRIPEIDTIGCFNHCSGLELTFDVYDYREGGNNDFVHRLPGGVSYP